MCFSATASFGAGSILSAIGIASLKKAKNPAQHRFAAIPLIFAVQQFTEGFLWLSFTHGSYSPFQKPGTYLFLFFAQVVWPFWVPYTIFKLEKNKKRKRPLRFLVAIGSLVSAYLAYCLLTYPVEGGIEGLHISYRQNYPPALSNYSGILYVIATIAPPFFSTVKRMWMLGLAILLSYIMTTIFYTDYIVSVWCFFASIISAAVLAILIQLKAAAPEKAEAITM